MNDLRDHAAIVTGAAGGMGAAIARAFAEEGRPLVLCDLHAGPLKAMAETLTSSAPITTVAGDVSSPSYPAQIIAALDQRKIGVLAHAAGVSPSMADGKRVFDINFIATKRIAEALLPHMAAGGVAILIASNSGQLIARPLFDRAIRKILGGKSSLLVQLMLRNPRSAYPVQDAVRLVPQS